MRVRLQPLPLMTAFAAIALAMLIALGVWQWRRYEEKRIAPAVAALITLEPVTRIEGNAQFVFRPRDGRPGWRVFEPVRYGERIVFADAGYLPGATPPDWRTAPPSQALSEASISGAVVHPRQKQAASGDPAKRLWYGVNLDAMAKAAGLSGVEPWYLAMPYVGPTGAAEPNPFALARDPLPPERHLGYALTWWGLAGTLIGVYLAFHARQGRFTIVR